MALSNPLKANPAAQKQAAAQTQAIYAPQHEALDAQAQNRTRNLALFNATIMEALTPFLEGARRDQLNAGNMGQGLGGNEALAAAHGSNNRNMGQRVAQMLNNQPIYMKDQANAERLMIESEVAQDRRALRGQEAQTQQEILQTILDRIFETEVFEQGVSERDRAAALDERAEDNAETDRRAARKHNAAMLALSQRDQDLAEQIAQDNYDVSFAEINRKQQADIMNQIENGKTPKGKAANKKKKRKIEIRTLSTEIGDWAVAQWDIMEDGSSITDSSSSGSTTGETQKEGEWVENPQFIGPGIENPEWDSSQPTVTHKNPGTSEGTSKKDGKVVKNSGKKRKIKSLNDLANRVYAKHRLAMQGLGIPWDRKRNIIRDAVLAATGFRPADTYLAKLIPRSGPISSAAGKKNKAAADRARAKVAKALSGGR